MGAVAADEVEAFIERHIAPPPRFPSDDVQTRHERAGAALEDAALARAALAGAVDVERLDALAKERAAERRTRAHAAHRRAVGESDAVAQWLTELTPVLPDDPDSMNVIVDRVTFIRSFADAGVVIDSHIGSLDSWARYRLQKSSGGVGDSGTGRLSFFILWHNPRTSDVVVNVGPRVVVNAHLAVDADFNGIAYWFISGSEARATIRARTTVWAMWNSSIQGIVSDIILGSAGAAGGFFGGDDSASLAVNQFVPGAGFAVPAHESILIEVSILTEWVVAGGSVDLDAESGSFQVSVPHLILTVT